MAIYVGDIKLSKQAELEMNAYGLHFDSDYKHALASYYEAYIKRPPAKSVPNRNMLKALRMLPWQNTSDDWARLHIVEAFLKRK